MPAFSRCALLIRTITNANVPKSSKPSPANTNASVVSFIMPLLKGREDGTMVAQHSEARAPDVAYSNTHVRISPSPVTATSHLPSCDQPTYTTLSGPGITNVPCMETVSAMKTLPSSSFTPSH